MYALYYWRTIQAPALLHFLQQRPRIAACFASPRRIAFK
jgi:hypothetical protein